LFDDAAPEPHPEPVERRLKQRRAQLKTDVEALRAGWLVFITGFSRHRSSFLKLDPPIRDLDRWVNGAVLKALHLTEGLDIDANNLRVRLIQLGDLAQQMREFLAQYTFAKNEKHWKPEQTRAPRADWPMLTLRGIREASEETK